MDGIYHEKQKLYRCGLHAVNNLLQKKEFTTKDFNKICANLKKGSLNKSVFNPHRGWFNMGNYDVNVLTEAITSKGYEFIWFDMRKDPKEIDFSEPNLAGLIVNTTIENFVSYMTFSKENHWITILKKGNSFINLDSKMDYPREFKENAELIDYLNYIKYTEGHIFLVKKSNH